jgi:hypothetical protein
MAVMLAAIVQRQSLCWLACRSTLALVMLLSVVTCVDVDGWIARVNVPAILAHRIPADYDYLASLSADAVPAMQRGLDVAQGEDRKKLTGAILAIRTRLSNDWQDWNVSEFRAGGRSGGSGGRQ